MWRNPRNFTTKYGILVCSLFQILSTWMSADSGRGSLSLIYLKTRPTVEDNCFSSLSAISLFTTEKKTKKCNHTWIVFHEILSASLAHSNSKMKHLQLNFCLLGSFILPNNHLLSLKRTAYFSPSPLSPMKKDI